MSGQPFPVDPVLVGIVQAYKNGALIADQVLPRLSPLLPREQFKWWFFDFGQFITLHDTKVGRKSSPNEVEFEAKETPAPDRLPYFDGNGAAALTTLTAFARSLLAGANAAAIVDALGLDGTFQPIASRGALSGFRNKLINPTFAIAQRGEIFTIPAGTAVYTADRWRIVNNTNRELTVQSPAPFSAGATGNKGRLRLNFFTPPTSGDVYPGQNDREDEVLGFRICGHRRPSGEERCANNHQRIKPSTQLSFA